MNKPHQYCEYGLYEGVPIHLFYTTTHELQQPHRERAFLYPQHFAYFVRNCEQGAKPRASINEIWMLFADTAGLSRN